MLADPYFSRFHILHHNGSSLYPARTFLSIFKRLSFENVLWNYEPFGNTPMKYCSRCVNIFLNVLEHNTTTCRKTAYLLRNAFLWVTVIWSIQTLAKLSLIISFGAKRLIYWLSDNNSIFLIWHYKRCGFGGQQKFQSLTFGPCLFTLVYWYFIWMITY